MKKMLIPTLAMSLFWGCGSGSSTRTTIDVAEYFPQEDMTKHFLIIQDDINNLYDEEIRRDENKITVEIDGAVKQNILIATDTISQVNSEDNITRIMKRYIATGEILYTLPKSTVVKDIEFEGTVLGHETIESKMVCRLETKITDIQEYDIKYDGDILRFKCIEDKTIVTDIKDNLPDYINLTDGEKKSDYDISYFYLKKGVGLIVEINDDCIVEDRDGMKIIDDTARQCREEHYTHTFLL